jgi:LysR family transcriptional regulator for metE and metH
MAGLDGVTLKQLRAFAAVARLGTIAAASQELHVTPPAVGQQLRSLEQMVGLPLVDRTEQGFLPTAAGRELLKTMAEVEVILQRGSDLLADIGGSGGPPVDFASVSTAKYFAPKILAGFQAVSPTIRVNLLVGNRSETIARLRDYEADVVIMGRPPSDLDLVVEPIAEHPHIVVAPPDHELVDATSGEAAGRRRITLRQLAREPFLVREEESGTRMLVERMFGQRGLQPTIAMVISSNETIKQAIMAGLGVGLLSAHTVAAELADGRLVELRVVGLPLVRHWYVVRRQAKSLLPGGQALWDFLVDEAADYVPSSRPDPAR